MPDSHPQILSAAREYVTDILLHKVSKTIRYHNLNHTEDVVMACEEMAGYYQLQPDDRQALLVAAWFHDTGFSSGDSNGHEEVSKQIATDFLQEHRADPAFIEKVMGCIDATHLPQSPKTLIEQIICDADLFHLGTDRFDEKNEALRQEMIDFAGEDLSRKKWRKMNISFLEHHKYFTDFGRRKLQPVKEQHLDLLKNADEVSGKGKKNKKEDVALAANAEEVRKKADRKLLKEKQNQMERGTSTMFRIITTNHTHLSQMADNKAHIMISVNSIILSVTVGLLIKRLDDHPSLVIPTILLVTVCVGAIIYAVLATRPNVSRGTFTREDIQAKKTNLLFFGNFHKMTLPDYDWAMKEMLADRDYMYGSMVKDIYYLGVVLARKYRLLRISYSIFMYGLIIAMLAFAIMMAYDAFFPTIAQKLPVSLG